MTIDDGGAPTCGSTDNNTLHTEPRAARLFLLASLSPRPGERWRYRSRCLGSVFGVLQIDGSGAIAGADSETNFEH